MAKKTKPIDKAKLQERMKKDPSLRAKLETGLAKAEKSFDMISAKLDHLTTPSLVHKPDTQTTATKARKHGGGKLQAAPAKECVPTQTDVKKVAKPQCESVQPAMAKAARVNDVRLRGHDLWGQAAAKAAAELQAEFDSSTLCKQGLKLYEIVLKDKTARLHKKLKNREKWKIKKQGSLSPKT